MLSSEKEGNSVTKNNGFASLSIDTEGERERKSGRRQKKVNLLEKVGEERTEQKMSVM